MNKTEIQEAIDKLEKNGFVQQAQAARRRLEKEEERNPEEVKIYFHEGRIFVEPPKISNPRKIHALKEKLKEVPTAQWEGLGYARNDPKRGIWSYQAGPEDRPRLIAKLKETLANFFPGAVVKNEHGDVRGRLEAS